MEFEKSCDPGIERWRFWSSSRKNRRRWRRGYGKRRKVSLFYHKRLLDYTEVGFLSKEEAEEKKREGNADRMKVPAAEKLEIQGVVPQNVLEISESVADRLRKNF